MDPFSITTGVAALIGLCVGVVQTIKSFIEKTKSTKDVLVRLLNRTERVRLYLEHLRSLSSKLTSSSHRSIALPFKQEECKATMRNLFGLIRTMVDASTKGKLQAAMALLREQKQIDNLTHQLTDHEQNIFSVLMLIATSAVSLDSIKSCHN